MGIRLTEQRFLILTGLANEPMHGYGLMAEIEAITEGRSKPRAGALYQALDVLADAGLVETAREEMVDGRIRKYFSLTSAGRERLVSESLNRRQEADVAMTRLGLA